MGTQSCECAEFVQGPISSIVRCFMSLSNPGLMTVRSVAITGIAVLAGFTRVSDPLANFHHFWRGGNTNPNALAMALVKTNYAYTGWSNAFSVLGEVNGTRPVLTVRNAGLISLGIVTMLFISVNLAYIAAVPLDDIKHSGQLIGALFFEHVFGKHWAAKILPISVALGCMGNIVSGMSHISSFLPSLDLQIAVVGVYARYVSIIAMPYVITDGWPCAYFP